MRALFMVVMAAISLAFPPTAAGQSRTPAPRSQNNPTSGDLAGAVSDSASTQPIPSAEIDVTRDGALVARATSDPFGKYIIHQIPTGTYEVQVRLIGYRLATRGVTIGAGEGTAIADFAMAVLPLLIDQVTVTAKAPVAVDTRTGNQVFQENDYHGSPTTVTSQILQQSIAGAARAPTGEVHIRGQHAEYTYYVDGVPVLPGISGSLNELFDPTIVGHAEFLTGGWDAEYGNKNTAVINITTQIPPGGFHSEISGFGGSNATNGQSLSMSDTRGRWEWFLTGSRDRTDMRQEPVMADPRTTKAINFHNDGEDLSGFGKLQYVSSTRDALTFDANWSRTKFAVPYDSTGGAVQDDHQTDINTFLNLGWRHNFPGGARAESESDLFAALFLRHGSLDYNPGSTDQPSFGFYPDTTLFNLSERRSFQTYGTKLDYHVRESHAVEWKVGTQASLTTGHENFVTTAADGSNGPASDSDLRGHDIGLYAQTGLLPAEWFELRTGLRYDSHTAPFAGTQHQVSPRIKLSFFPDPSLTAYAYYGRLFMPTNIEDLRAITSVADSGVVAAPTLPERDDFYELAIVRRLPRGTVVKVAGYVKNSVPGIDDNTVPGSAITTSVNLGRVAVRGLEAVLEFRPPGPISGYWNFALNHAYGHGPVTGGFFPTDIADVPGRWFDLDHDQRISSVGSIVYSAHRYFVSATGIYGTGLTNGAAITSPIGTGLFDFNRAIHVDPSFIVNASAGYTIPTTGVALRPEIYVDNLFNSHYLLKGAFFSGASVGRPRSVQVRLGVGF